MNETNRQVVLRSRPSGLVADENVELVETDVPALGDGEALVRTSLVGIDAAVRTWLDDQPGYLPPVQLGEVVRAATVGEVVATNCEAYQVGDVVTTLGGFSDYSIARDDLYTTVMGRMSEGTAGIDRAGLLAVFGSTGATAYFGMHDIGKPQAGETVLVSAAAGATGSIAGQLAKAAGARVVGLAEMRVQRWLTTDAWHSDSARRVIAVLPRSSACRNRASSMRSRSERSASSVSVSR